MPIRGLLSQITARQVQLQVATSADGGTTETDVITLAIAPSGQNPYYGFYWFWMDERGGPVDSTGVTHYLISTADASTLPHLWHSTDETLQSWKEIQLPAEQVNPIPGRQGIPYDGLRVHKTGTIVIVAAVFLSPGPDGGSGFYLATYRYTAGRWTSNYRFAGQVIALLAAAPYTSITEGDDGSLYLSVSRVSTLYKSVDDGTTWIPIFQGGVGPLKYFTAMGASGPGLPALFVSSASGGAPSVSKNDAVTWNQVTGVTGLVGDGNRHSFVARLPDGTYLLKTSSGLFHSTDASGLTYQQEALPSGFSGIEALATGDRFVWLVLDNDGKGPYLYKRNTDASYHPDLTGLLTLLATARDAGAYYITSVSSVAFDFYTQYGIPAWGVDSLTPANTMVSSTQTLFDAVTAQAVSKGGSAPAFWGRYIGATGNLGPGEVTFLHNHNCRVLLIYRDTAAMNAQIFTYEDGVAHATRAIASAQQLRAPSGTGVRIYADIEIMAGFPVPTVDFFRGWFDTMQTSGYGGGVYGNTSPAQAANFNNPFCAAYDISFMQTDTLADCPPKQYFGNPVGGNPAASLWRREATISGTPGIVPVLVTMNAGEADVIYVLWEITAGTNVSWGAGNWTVRLDVTMSNLNIVWNGVEIDHVDQNCSGIERLGSLDGQAISLASTGVMSMVVPGIAPATQPALSDKVLLQLSFTNLLNAQATFGFTPDQLIDAPFTRVGAFVYANQPEPGASGGCGDFTFNQFSPDVPPCKPPTVIYQYIGNCNVDNTGTPPQQVDYDLASAAGFTSMW